MVCNFWCHLIKNCLLTTNPNGLILRVSSLVRGMRNKARKTRLMCLFAWRNKCSEGQMVYDISQRMEFLNLPRQVKSELSALPRLLNDLVLLYLNSPPKANLLKLCSPVWYYWEVVQPSRGQRFLGHWGHAFEKDYGTPVNSYSQLLPDQENKFYYAIRSTSSIQVKYLTSHQLDSKTVS